MITNILKILAIFLLCVVIFYGATCTYANFIKKDEAALVEPPDREDASFMLLIKNTLDLIYAEDCTVEGEGERETYIIKGFWENRDDKYVYNGGAVPLSEEIFGPIELSRR